MAYLLKRWRNIIYIILTFPLILGFCLGAENPSDDTTIKRGVWKGNDIYYIDHYIAIKFKNNVSENIISEVLQSINGKVTAQIKDLRWIIMELDLDENIFSNLERVEKLKSVELAVPRVLYNVTSVPDPYFSLQWYLQNTGQTGGKNGADIRAKQAWEITTGDTNVVLAILDSGIPLSSGLPSHPDLDDPSKIIIGPDFIYYWFHGRPDGESDPSINDEYHHGTHVAGIAAAEGDNGEGILGVCKKCKILAIQVFGHRSYPPDPMVWTSTDSAILNGFYYAVNYQLNNPGKRVIINFSGGGDYSNPLVEQAVSYADSHNVLVVAAAGNDIYYHNIGYPARYSLNYDNIIAVGATNYGDSLTFYSSYGTSINITAPGGSCGSTSGTGGASFIPYGVQGYSPCDIYSTIPGGYGYMMGTSMAAPLVTGTAGLMLSVNPSLTADNLRYIIQNSADDKGSTGWDQYYGHGRLNAFQAVLQASGDTCEEPPNGTPILSLNGFEGSHPTIYWTTSKLCQLAGYKIYRALHTPSRFSLIATVGASTNE